MNTFPAIALAFAVALVSAAAWADPPSPQQACQSSARQLCPKEVAAMDRQAAKACLLKNLAKATPECRAAIAARMPKPAPAG
jgi:hypothetical protein